MFVFKGAETPTVKVDTSKPEESDIRAGSESDPELEPVERELREQVARAEALVAEFGSLPDDAFARQEVSNRIGRALFSFFENMKTIKLPQGTGVATGMTIGALLGALNLTNVSDFTLLDYVDHKERPTQKELAEIGEPAVSKVEQTFAPVRGVINVGVGGIYGLLAEGAVTVLLKIVEAVKKKEDIPQESV
ncbi:MAG: hypothetical protein WCJ25_05200 [Candidatus Moraniibacteriota bacterium]